MALTPSEAAVAKARAKIAVASTEVQVAVKRGETSIDNALVFPYGRFGELGYSAVNVFDLWEKVPQKARELLTELYAAVGWKLTWISTSIDGRATEQNEGFLQPLS